MLIYLSKGDGPEKDYHAERSTAKYLELAVELGFDPAVDEPTLNVSVDGGRTVLVTPADEMSLVDGMQVSIKW